jgi:hypothetical protein
MAIFYTHLFNLTIVAIPKIRWRFLHDFYSFILIIENKIWKIHLIINSFLDTMFVYLDTCDCVCFFIFSQTNYIINYFEHINVKLIRNGKRKNIKQNNYI